MTPSDLLAGAAGLAVADVADAWRGPGVFDDEGAAVVEDHDGVAFVDDVDVLSAAGVADVEPDPTRLYGPVQVDRRDPDSGGGAALRGGDRGGV